MPEFFFGILIFETKHGASGVRVLKGTIMGSGVRAVLITLAV